MKQKLLSVLLTLMVGVSGMYVQADPIDSGTCGEDLNWSISEDYVLSITGSGAMTNYGGYSNKAPWREKYESSIVEIQFPDGLTTVGDYAFFYCDKVKSVTIPEGVTYIGEWAFCRCSKIERVSLPSTLKEIGASAFAECTSLGAITIPAAVETIHLRAFAQCLSMTSMVVEDGNTKYDSRNNCNAIIETKTNTLISGCKASIIPDDIEVIGVEAFDHISLLTAITIPNSVTTINNYAFRMTEGMQTLTIPASVTYIHLEAFTGCKNLKSISVDKANTTYDSRNDCNAIIETATNSLILGCENTVIPNDIEIIEKTAFYWNLNIKTMSIPASVKSIGAFAFYYCTNIESLTCLAEVPPTLGGAYTFGSVNKDIPVYVPESKIDDYKAADGWKEFTNYIGLDEGCTSIASGSIDKTEISWVIDCDSVLTVSGTGAIPNYTELSTDIPWHNYSHAIKKIVVEEGITRLGAYAFYQLYHVTHVSLPSTLTNIGFHEFKSCMNLVEVELKSVPNVNTVNSFENCPALTTIWCPCDESLYYLDDFVEGSVRLIAYWDKLYRKCDSKHPVFYGICGDNGGSNVTWKFEEGKVSLEGSGAMSFCWLAPWDPATDFVTEIEIADGITNIGDNVFMGCKNVKLLEIPASVTSIGEDALYGCSGLEQMICHAQTPPALVEGGFAYFYEVNRDIPVYVPKASIPAYQAADGWKEFTNYHALEGDDPEPEACSEDKQGTCGENLTWLITCDDELVISGTGAMTEYSSSNAVPWKKFSSTVKTITLKEGITSISKYAFYQFSAVKEMVIPEGVTSIGENGLSSMSKLESVSLPNSLTTIKNYAFTSCPKLTSLNIPKNVSSIGLIIIEYCNAITSLSVDKENTTFDSRDNCNAVIKTATNTLVIGTNVTVIPNTVTAIGRSAFQRCSAMTQMAIPSSVTTIDGVAFGYCTGLTSIEIPASVTSISGEAFNGCDGLQSMVVDSENTKYDSRNNCNAIIETETNILVCGCAVTVIPEDVTAIGEYAFDYCKAMKSFTIPASVKSIGRSAFAACTNLESLTCLNQNPPTIANQYTFSNVPTDIPVYVPKASVEDYQAANFWNKFTNFVGMGPTVVPDDKPTTITFDEEGNDGTALFNATANDFYNAEENRLEISTTLSDEQVAEALENLVPGSSAWVAALPGSITFDVPAGKGEIEIKCQTFPGYELKVKIDGKSVISVTQSSLGKAKVSYNVEVDTHVVIYLHGGSGSAPARIATNAQDGEGAGAYVESITITPAQTATSIESLKAEGKTQKFLMDGRLLIMTQDGKVYDVTGTWK